MIGALWGPTHVLISWLALPRSPVDEHTRLEIATRSRASRFTALYARSTLAAVLIFEFYSVVIPP